MNELLKYGNWLSEHSRKQAPVFANRSTVPYSKVSWPFRLNPDRVFWLNCRGYYFSGAVQTFFSKNVFI